jgi:hypothetical protein
MHSIRQFPLRECVLDRIECGRPGGEERASVADLEDRVFDVAFMDGGIIEHEREGRGAVGQGRTCEEINEEGTEDIARVTPFGPVLRFLLPLRFEMNSSLGCVTCTA